jgi:hypothetical protein
MSSHSRSKTRSATRKKTSMKTYRRKKRTLSYQQRPFAPAELDAMLGYGTSSSFPLFMTGLVSMIKKAVSHRSA